MSKDYWKIAVAGAFTLPAIIARLSGLSLTPLVAVMVFGGGVVAASFMLAWAAEAAQVDISASLATALLALIAVLPEYAVDLYFAYTSGSRPEYGAYAAANMTGSNRLLIGVGWPLVVLLFALAARRRGDTRRPVALQPRRRVELGFLGIASVYAFIIPLKRTLSLLDAVVLLGLFGAYLWRTSKEEREEPELHGLPATIAKERPSIRRAIVVGLFVGAAMVITMAAKPFADNLVESGRRLGIDEFLLVQWFAPLSSEAPELLVASILALRGHDETALGTLLSSKVNQWTLLVGSLPLAHAFGGGGFTLALDPRQTEEFLLTAAQAIFAVTLLLGLRLGAREALLLLVTFVAQLFLPHPSTRLVFAAAYCVAALALLVWRRNSVLPTLRSILSTRSEISTVRRALK